MYNNKENLYSLKLHGDKKNRCLKAIGRLKFFLSCLFFGFFLIGFKITNLSILYNKNVFETNNYFKKNNIYNKRADIVDRNGVILATSLPWDDLCVNPRLIRKEDKLKLSKSIAEILDLNEKEIYKKLNSKKSFVYLKRSITPKNYNAIMKLKEPGIFKLKQYKRYYPHQEHASHILGGVNIDNIGIKGIEKNYDKILRDKNFINQNKKLNLSIDIRIQKILDDKLGATISKHKALGGAGIILDIKNSEILAMSSLPQFNPNKMSKLTKKKEFNKTTSGVYELGSVFKSLTVAMALDKEIVNEDTIYDATEPLKEGKYTIHDYHPQERHLKISECITYSSNICFAQVGQDLGEKNIIEYINKMGLNNKAEIEIPEIGQPLYFGNIYLPSKWKKTNIMTFSYGHGVAVSPLQFVNAFTSVINGGNFRNSTLIKDKYLNNVQINRVIKEETSYKVRKLLREVVSKKEGSGDKANVPGYSVAGKTGTAIKSYSNRYNNSKNITSFIGFFPSYNPQFLVFIMVDDPKKIKETFNFVTGGWVAAPTVKRIIEEMSPMLGILPKKQLDKNYNHASLNN